MNIFNTMIDERRPEGGDEARPREALQADRPTAIQLASQDFADALGQSWFWLSLGWNDIVQRYRGSLLGPFWLTITTAVFIGGLGPLYAMLFKLDVQQYLPYMALGILVWNFITGVINDCCRAFIEVGAVMKQMKLPRMTVIFHVLWRNVIVFAHNLPVYAAVVFYCSIPINANTLMVLPGFVLLCLNLLWIGLLVAIICLRYRDVLQIVSSLLLLGFFVTPVMWNPKLQLQQAQAWVVNLNPLAAFIELVRAPLLGEPMSTPLLVMALVCLVLGTSLTAALFVRCRKQIIYWI